MESNLVHSDDVSNIKEENGWVVFGIIVLVYFLLDYINSHYIITDEVFYRSFSDQLSIDNIRGLLKIQEKYWWIGKLLLPVIILIRVSFAAICISIGAILASMDFEFKTVFKAALLAEIVFILAQIVYMIILYINVDKLTLDAAGEFYPLTMLQLVGANQTIEWLKYPLQALNLFEVIYIFLFTFLLSERWEYNFNKSAGIVIPSYTMGVIFWLTLVTFALLQLE